LQDVEIEYLRI